MGLHWEDHNQGLQEPHIQTGWRECNNVDNFPYCVDCSAYHRNTLVSYNAQAWIVILFLEEVYDRLVCFPQNTHQRSYCGYSWRDLCRSCQVPWLVCGCWAGFHLIIKQMGILFKVCVCMSVSVSALILGSFDFRQIHTCWKYPQWLQSYVSAPVLTSATASTSTSTTVRYIPDGQSTDRSHYHTLPTKL